MAVNNSTILDQIWLNGTNDYQQRVPQRSQAGISGVQEFLFDPMNKQYYNEFVDSLIGRIGMLIINSKAWQNPLSQFKRGRLTVGQTIQEIGNKLLRAHGYSLDDGNLFTTERPESVVAYHTVNREDRYDLTVNATELRKAFADDFGLNKYLVSLLSLPKTSDEYDEYKIMSQLLAEADSQAPFFAATVPDITSLTATTADTQAFIKAVRSFAGKLRFLSSLYNRAGVPTSGGELVLLTTPNVIANVDVNVLASAFNVSAAELQERVVLLDELPMPNVVAILASRDLFVCADYVYETTSFYNPKTLSTNYYLHHWGVYSISPFMPAIKFTTGAATSPTVVTMNPTDLTLSAKANGTAIASGYQMQLGDEVVFSTNLIGTVTPASESVANGGVVDVLPDAVLWNITAPAGINLNSRTYIDSDGKLHLQAGLDTVTLTVLATSVYLNPSGNTTSETATFSVVTPNI